MSGPIVRKYGFPNFEKIFGERELKHGAEAGATNQESASTPADTSRPARKDEPAKEDAAAPKT